MPIGHGRLDRDLAFDPFRDALDVQRVANGRAERLAIEKVVVARAFHPDRLALSPTHGDQEGTAWNGHFGCKCYHPLFVFNQFSDLERCALRKGNVHSADGWNEVLAPVIARYKSRDLMRFFRADAAFAIPELYEMLEAEGYFYTALTPKPEISGE